MQNLDDGDFKKLLTDPFNNSVNKKAHKAWEKCFFIRKPEGKEKLKKHFK